MQDKYKINLSTGLVIDTVHPEEIGEDIVETPCTDSFYIPKWNGEAWEEGATQEYIDSLKMQTEPQEPSLEERIQALEVMELERILGGGF